MLELRGIAESLGEFRPTGNIRFRGLPPAGILLTETPMQIFQCTVGRPVSCQGVGLHSGKPVTLTVHPAPPNHGIRFLRADLPNRPVIPALFRNVVDTSLATVIGVDGVIVSTIEHIMGSFAGLGVDNALVELSAYEVPIMDGSAGFFTGMIAEAGISPQKSPRFYFIIEKPISHKEGDRWVTVTPADSFSISCTIDFTHPLLGRQNLDLLVTPENFGREISQARTFGFLQEIDYLKLFGFAKGGSLENAIVLDCDSVINAEGLRFPDEFVRHKILDCLGDFSLIGIPILGRVETHKSGHQFNHAFLEAFFAAKDSWRTSALDTAAG